MTAILKVDTIQDTSGNNIINENANTITIGKSGDTVNLAAGATAGFGKVLQVLSAIDTTKRSTTSTSYVTGSNTLSVNITPASTSNKILIITSYQTFGIPSTANCFSTVQRTVSATTTDLATNKFGQDYNGHTISVSTAFLDSPNTTAQCTYQVYFKSNGGTVYLNAADASNTVDGSIVVMEVAG